MADRDIIESIAKEAVRLECARRGESFEREWDEMHVEAFEQVECMCRALESLGFVISIPYAKEPANVQATGLKLNGTHPPGSAAEQQAGEAGAEHRIQGLA